MGGNCAIGSHNLLQISCVTLHSSSDSRPQGRLQSNVQSGSDHFMQVHAAVWLVDLGSSMLLRTPQTQCYTIALAPLCGARFTKPMLTLHVCGPFPVWFACLLAPWTAISNTPPHGDQQSTSQFQLSTVLRFSSSAFSSAPVGLPNLF